MGLGYSRRQLACQAVRRALEYTIEAMGHNERGARSMKRGVEQDLRVLHNEIVQIQRPLLNLSSHC